MPRAIAIAAEIESLCKSYLAALVLGEPPRLSRDEMARVIHKFKTYGQTARSEQPNPAATGDADLSTGAGAQASGRR